MAQTISAPTTGDTLPVPSPKLLKRIVQNTRPYHLAVAALVALITAVFAGLVAVLLLVATNFNILDWME